MSIKLSDVLCALECKKARAANKYVLAQRAGHFSAVKSLSNQLLSLRMLHFLIIQNNIDEACFDNCELNQKLESYGLPRL